MNEEQRLEFERLWGDVIKTEKMYRNYLNGQRKVFGTSFGAFEGLAHDEVIIGQANVLEMNMTLAQKRLENYREKLIAEA